MIVAAGVSVNKHKWSKKQVETVFTKFINLESNTEQNTEINPQRFRFRPKENEIRDQKEFSNI